MYLTDCVCLQRLQRNPQQAPLIDTIKAVAVNDAYAHSAALGHRAKGLERKRRCQICTKPLPEDCGRLCVACATPVQPVAKPAFAGTGSDGGGGSWRSQPLRLRPGRDCPPQQQAVVAAETEVAVTRMLMQLSEVYKVMQIATLAKLAAPVDFADVEMIIVEGMRSGLLKIRVDHQHSCINFESQPFGSTMIKDTLSGLSLHLGETMTSLGPKTDVKKVEQQAIYEEILRNISGEQKRVLSRKKIIEERKKEEEQRTTEEEDARSVASARAKALHEEQEKQCVNNESNQRMKDKLVEEEKESELQQMKEMIRDLISSDPDNPDTAELRDLTDEQIKELDLKTIVKKHNKAADAEREKAEKKLAAMQRRLDHFECAKRLQEIPPFEEMYVQQKAEDKEFSATSHATMLTEHRERYEQDMSEKTRLLRMRV